MKSSSKNSNMDEQVKNFFGQFPEFKTNAAKDFITLKKKEERKVISRQFESYEAQSKVVPMLKIKKRKYREVKNEFKKTRPDTGVIPKLVSKLSLEDRHFQSIICEPSKPAFPRKYTYTENFEDRKKLRVDKIRALLMTQV